MKLNGWKKFSIQSENLGCLRAESIFSLGEPHYRRLKSQCRQQWCEKMHCCAEQILPESNKAELYFSTQILLNSGIEFWNFHYWRRKRLTQEFQRDYYIWIFGLPCFRLETSSLSCHKNFSRSVPSQFSYCNKKHYLCYMFLLQNSSMRLFFSFEKIEPLAFFANMKPSLVNVDFVSKIIKKSLSVAIHRNLF